MSQRPRIRSIKPELWHDERVGDLSRDARLLFIGLITMADDEGRLRALPSLILGHCFPYDLDAARKLGGWVREIVDAGVLVTYEVDGKPYAALPSFTEHQRINRPSRSRLPAPPGGSDSRSAHGALTEPPMNDHGSSCDPITDRSSSPAGARSGADRIGSGSGEAANAASARGAQGGRSRSSGSTSARGRVDQLVPPRELPTELADRLDPVLAVLGGIQAERGGHVPTPRGVGLVIADFPRRDHLSVAHELRYWALAGRGQGKQILDWVRQWRSFLERSPDADPSRPPSSTAPMARPGGRPTLDDHIATAQRRAEEARQREQQHADVIDGQEAA